MLYKDSHVSDEELLLAADGELTAGRQAYVRLHLQACWACRRRMGEVEDTIADFVGAYHALLDPHVSAGDTAEARLRRRLADRSAATSHWRGRNVWAGLAAAFLIAVLASGYFFHWSGERAIPDPRLTPGETMTASRSDVCGVKSEAESQKVPAALREAVFLEYGMKDAPRNAYEVDFLITPGLGGSSGIRNLWPQPYNGGSWNAHAKDALEDRLHTLVCSGDLDLPTAQRDIATNWVDAYKKYVGSAQNF